MVMTHVLSQGSPNISSKGRRIDFFGPPWAKAKKLICEKQLINNCKQTIYLKKSDALTESCNYLGSVVI